MNGLETVAAAVGGGRQKLVVAVVDQAFALDHPELAEKIEPGGHDFFEGDQDPGTADPNDVHGSTVAGVAVGGSDRIRLLPVRGIGPDGRANGRLVEAIGFAASRDPSVVNLSLYLFGEQDVNAAKAIFGDPAHADTLFVLAAGNFGRQLGTGSMLAGFNIATIQLDNVIVVSAATAEGTRLENSNFGVPYADVAALHEHDGPAPGGGTAKIFHTSGAAPVVSNIAAKVRIVAPLLTPAEVKRVIVETCDASSHWEGLVNSGGLVNPERAVRLAALIHLVREGVPRDAAADRLGLEGAERERLLGLLEGFVPPATSKTP